MYPSQVIETGLQHIICSQQTHTYFHFMGKSKEVTCIPYNCPCQNGSARDKISRKQPETTLKSPILEMGARREKEKHMILLLPHVHGRVKHMQYMRKRPMGFGTAFSSTPSNRECLMAISGSVALHLIEAFRIHVLGEQGSEITDCSCGTKPELNS